MSRCFPYPPPYLGEAEIESIKLEKEKLRKELKAEKKRLKKEKKKEKRAGQEKHDSSKDSKHLKESRKRKYEELGLSSKSEKHSKREKHEGGYHNSKKSKDEQLERSGLSEEHGQSFVVPSKCESPGSQDSSKRRGAGTMPSPSPSLTNSGSTIRIKLPAGTKPREQAPQTPASGSKPTAVTVPTPVAKPNGATVPRASTPIAKPNGISVARASALVSKPNGSSVQVAKSNGVHTSQVSASNVKPNSGPRSSSPFAKPSGGATQQDFAIAPKSNGVTVPKAPMAAWRLNGLSKVPAPVGKSNGVIVPKGPAVRPSELFATKEPAPVVKPNGITAQQPKPPVQMKPRVGQEPSGVSARSNMAKDSGAPRAMVESSSKTSVQEEKRGMVQKPAIPVLQLKPTDVKQASLTPHVQTLKPSRQSDPAMRRESSLPPVQMFKSKQVGSVQQPIQALNANLGVSRDAPTVIANQENKPASPIEGPRGNDEPCFSGRKTETEKKHEKKHHKSHRKSKRKEAETLYEELIINWKRPALEVSIEDSDDDWLFSKPKVEKVEKKEEMKEDDATGQSSQCKAGEEGQLDHTSDDGVHNYQTRAVFMPEFNMYQMPFVVPF